MQIKILHNRTGRTSEINSQTVIIQGRGEGARRGGEAVRSDMGVNFHIHDRNITHRDVRIKVKV